MRCRGEVGEWYIYLYLDTQRLVVCFVWYNGCFIRNIKHNLIYDEIVGNLNKNLLQILFIQLHYEFIIKKKFIFFPFIFISNQFLLVYFRLSIQFFLMICILCSLRILKILFIIYFERLLHYYLNSCISNINLKLSYQSTAVYYLIYIENLLVNFP